MSEGNHFMRRSMRKVLKDASSLLWQDIKALWIPIMVIAFYYTVGRRFLYSMCPVVSITGFPCPGCGLTRAGFALLRLDFARAFEIHPMIYPIAVLIMVFFLYRYILKRNTKVLSKWLLGILLAMIVLYIYRMIRYFPGEPPMSYYYNALIPFLKR